MGQISIDGGNPREMPSETKYAAADGQCLAEAESINRGEYCLQALGIILKSGESLTLGWLSVLMSE
jgi:hypothetical protein